MVQTKPDVLARLDRLQEVAQLSPRARANRDALADRLRAPVRIGIFGLPGSGKSALMNALSGHVIADTALLPTTELRHGDRLGTQAILQDGSRRELDGPPTPDLLRQGPAFLKLQVPAPDLIGRQVLLVVTEANFEDLRAGLRWAAGRVDIALFCTAGWSAPERALWEAAPDSLRDHALLIRTGGPAPQTAPTAAFEAEFGIETGPDGPDPAGVRVLSAHLDSLIDEATTQTVHLAQMFLQRHDPHPAPCPPAGKTHTATGPAAPCPEAAADLARLFQTLRQSSHEMLVALRRGGPGAGDPSASLAAFETLFDRLAERIADMDRVQEAWPTLETQLTEARDLALLLRIEGGSEQVTDAARMLLQIRTEIETGLAA